MTHRFAVVSMLSSVLSVAPTVALAGAVGAVVVLSVVRGNLVERAWPLTMPKGRS